MDLALVRRLTAVSGRLRASWANAALESDRSLLRRRLGRFIHSSARGRQPLADLLSRFARPQWDALVFGGFLRDLMLFAGRAIPRDIDLVVQSSEPAGLSKALSGYLRRRTRFGGYVLGNKGWRLDVWPIEQTWALREGLIDSVGPEGLVRSTFLNLEAVAVSLRSRGRGGRRVYDHGFFEGVRDRLLDINLEENPYPELCIVRSLITAASLNFGLSMRLVGYIDTHSRSIGVDSLLEVQERHYGFVRRYGDYLDFWLHFLRKRIARTRSSSITLPQLPYGQLELLGSTNVEIAIDDDRRSTQAHSGQTIRA